MSLRKMDDLVGQTINYWTILEARPNKQKGMVLAKCICGKEVITRGRSILNQVSKSCGCKRVEYARRGIRIPGSKPALKKTYSCYRTKAINQNLSFELSIEEFEYLTSLNCFYCNKEPTNIFKTNTDNYTYNGLDRVNNSKGYIKTNIVTCCGDCNTRKGSITKEMIYKLYNWFENEKS